MHWMISSHHSDGLVSLRFKNQLVDWPTNDFEVFLDRSIEVPSQPSIVKKSVWKIEIEICQKKVEVKV